MPRPTRPRLRISCWYTTDTHRLIRFAAYNPRLLCRRRRSRFVLDPGSVQFLARQRYLAGRGWHATWVRLRRGTDLYLCRYLEGL